jgi:hypothetical protein
VAAARLPWSFVNESTMTAVNMNDLIFRPNKSAVVKRLVLSCVMFVAAAMWIAPVPGMIVYLPAGFFALCMLLDIVQLLTGSTYLRLAQDGLALTSLFGVYKIPWNVIDRFLVVELKRFGLRKAVGFNFVQTYDRYHQGRRLSLAISQCEGTLPDTYGHKPEELAEILNRFLAHFNAANGEQSGEPESPMTQSLES